MVPKENKGSAFLFSVREIGLVQRRSGKRTREEENDSRFGSGPWQEKIF